MGRDEWALISLTLNLKKEGGGCGERDLAITAKIRN